MADELMTAQWRSAAQQVARDHKRPKNQSRELETIRAASALIAAFETGGGDATDPGAVSLLVDLSRLARDKQRLLRYAKLLLKLSERDHAKAANQLVACFFQDGDFKSARRHAALIPDKSLRSGTRKRLATLDILRDIATQQEQVQDLMRQPADARLPEAAVRTLGAHLEPPKAACLHAVLCGIPSIAEAGEPAGLNAGGPPADPLKLVFCGGFKWSGASAVCDFLADFPGSARAPGAMRFFTGSGFTIQSLAGAFRAGDKSALVSQMRGLSLRLFAGIMVGEKLPDKDLLGQWSASVAALEWQDGRDDIAGITLDFFRQLLAALDSDTPAFPSAAFQRFIEALVRLTMPGDTRVVLFDSVLRAPDCALVSLLDDARMVCVLRDPRDMFVTLVTRGGGARDVEPYIAELQSMLLAYEAGSSEACSVVQFEDFIQSGESREAVREQVLGEGPAEPPRPVFDPRDSATNIGVFRQYDDTQAVTRLAEAFPGLCRAT